MNIESVKILLLPPKCEIIFVTFYKKQFFQYCYRNIGLFSIAPHLVIALPTLRQQKLSLLISLLQILYKFCRFFQLLRQQYLSLLNTLAKTNDKLIVIAIVGRAIPLERKPTKKKQRTDTKKDEKRIMSDNNTWSNREKSNIALAKN